MATFENLHLVTLPTGILLIFLGVIMVAINHLRTKEEEKDLEKYVQQKLGKSLSGAPLVKSPIQESCDVLVVLEEKANNPVGKTSSIVLQNAPAEHSECPTGNGQSV